MIVEVTPKELRILMDLSQVQMAEQSGFDQGHISRIERTMVDELKMSSLRRYIEALGGKLELVIRIGERTFRLKGT